MNGGISSAGTYRSDDAESRGRGANNGVVMNDDGRPRAAFSSAVCAQMRYDAKNPERIYLQNHPGVYRSDDGGDTWIDIAKGLPSVFGFPLVAHPRPRRYRVPDSARVRDLRDADRRRDQGLRTRDAGESWEALGKGLPQQDAYFSVLRDAFTSDSLDPAGLYFGTRGAICSRPLTREKLALDRRFGCPRCYALKAAVVAYVRCVFIFHLRSVDGPATNEIVEIAATRRAHDSRRGDRDAPAAIIGCRSGCSTRQNNIRRHVNVFVDGENVRFANVAQPR